MDYLAEKGHSWRVTTITLTTTQIHPCLGMYTKDLKVNLSLQNHLTYALQITFFIPNLAVRVKVNGNVGGRLVEMLAELVEKLIEKLVELVDKEAPPSDPLSLSTFQAP